MRKHTISETVIKLSKIGKSSDLLQAVEKERKNPNESRGTSDNGRVTVIRVGTVTKRR